MCGDAFTVVVRSISTFGLGRLLFIFFFFCGLKDTICILSGVHLIYFIGIFLRADESTDVGIQPELGHGEDAPRRI